MQARYLDVTMARVERQECTLSPRNITKVCRYPSTTATVTGLPSNPSFRIPCLPDERGARRQPPAFLLIM